MHPFDLAKELHRAAKLAQAKKMHPKKEPTVESVSTGFDDLCGVAQDHYIAMAKHILNNYQLSRQD